MHPFSKLLIRIFLIGAVVLATVAALIGFGIWLAAVAYRFGPVLIIVALIFYWLWSAGKQAEREEQEELQARQKRQDDAADPTVS